VVVIDDPVSSLDSQVLFVVSALVRKLVARAEKSDDHALRQVFVLTHNAYFHREVTFDKHRGTGCKNTESFWVVRRASGKSTIEARGSNPVSTGYELLWDEVRSPSGSSTGVANAMRRILEYYFQILGGEKLQDIDQLFDGQEQLVCKALLSWSNQGSHLPADDMFVAAETYESEKYQEVFRKVFEKTQHDAHYRMMMKIGVDS
jgi:wobble nucleotide-excising tRNase